MTEAPPVPDTWIKLPMIRFPRRARVAILTERDLAPAVTPKKLFDLWCAREVPGEFEELVRLLVASATDVPEGFTLSWVKFEPHRCAIMVGVEHPEFDEPPEGSEAPVLPRRRREVAR